MKKRIFLGVPISQETREKIGDQLHGVPGRLVPKENWHFTLHFLGEIESEKIATLEQILKEVALGESFKSTITHFNAFPNLRSARILWLGVTEGSVAFCQLAEHLANVLVAHDFRLDHRDYIPHLTLSRLSVPLNINRWIKQTPFKKIHFKVEEIALYESKRSSEGGPPLYFPLFQRTL